MTEQHGRPGFDRRMTKEEINLCPLGRWQGEVQVVRSVDQLDEVLQQLAAERLLGFDTETRPAYRKGESYPPALLQLAGAKKVYIFQLGQLGLPPGLCGLLENPAIVKAGVSLDYDLRELQKFAPFTPRNFVELSTLAKKARIHNHGLRGLAAVLLGFRIAKGAKTSNWQRDQLSEAQVAYAATDAWVGRELYRALTTHR